MKVMPAWLTQLNREVVACARCPRLVKHCQAVAREKRRAYLAWKYWGKPVPGFTFADAVEIWGDEIERITKVSPLTGETIAPMPRAATATSRPPGPSRRPRSRC